MLRLKSEVTNWQTLASLRTQLSSSWKMASSGRTRCIGRWKTKPQLSAGRCWGRMTLEQCGKSFRSQAVLSSVGMQSPSSMVSSTERLGGMRSRIKSRFVLCRKFSRQWLYRLFNSRCYFACRCFPNYFFISFCFNCGDRAGCDLRRMGSSDYSSENDCCENCEYYFLSPSGGGGGREKSDLSILSLRWVRFWKSSLIMLAMGSGAALGVKLDIIIQSDYDSYQSSDFRYINLRAKKCMNEA